MTINLFDDNPGIGRFAYAGINDAATADPGANSWKKNTADTRLEVDDLALDGADASSTLAALVTGNHVYLRIAGESRTYVLTADATAQAGYTELTVTLDTSSTGFTGPTVADIHSLLPVGGGGAGHGTGSVGQHGDFDMTLIAPNKIPKWDGVKFTMQDDLSGGGGAAVPRSRAFATVTADIPAGTVAVGPGGDSTQNLSANLIDYTSLVFATNIELDINGGSKVGAAGATEDVYPAVTALDIAAGGFRSTKGLLAGDVVQVFTGGGSAPWSEDVYAPTLGQITFILSSTPTEPSSLSVHANGIEAVETADYTLSGLNVTWLNTEFSFEVGDGVVIQYK